LEEEKEHIDILIAKVALGEATPEEIVKLYDWEHLSEENGRYVAEGSKVFEHVAQIEVDTDAAWLKLKNRIAEGDEKPIVPMRPSPRKLNIYWAAAASVAILLGAFFLFKKLNSNGIVNQGTYATQGSTLQDTLADGTIAFLNKNTEIIYTETKDKREVKLKGEAFFTIKHDAEKPFVIEANQVFIKDIGTAFNVKTEANGSVEVFVESGIVDFYTEANKGIRLNAGEAGHYNAKTKTFTKDQDYVSPNIISYKTKQLNFEATPLSAVVTQLNTMYNANIEIGNEAIKNCPITVKFNDEDLNTIINIITQTLNIEANQKDGKIILLGGGC
jgi:transmembrane sensor